MIETRRGCAGALLVYGVTLMLLPLVDDAALVVFGASAIVVLGVTLMTSRGLARVTRFSAQLVAALAFSRVPLLARRHDSVWILVIGAIIAFGLAHVIEPRATASAAPRG